MLIRTRQVAGVATALLCVLFYICLESTVFAQAAPKPSPNALTRDLLVEQLGSDDYAERQAASRRLLADEKLALGDLGQRYLTAPPEEEAARRNDLVNDFAALYAKARTPEQRDRLVDIARHHFVQLLRLREWPGERSAALGVIQAAIMPDEVPEVVRHAIRDEFSRDDVPVVRVVNTLPGFPAYAHLEPGDLVVKVNDAFLPAGDGVMDTSSHFGRTIMSQTQGSSMRLLLWRSGKFLPVTVQLASSDAIRNLYEPTDSRLLLQFRVKWWQFHDRMIGRTGRPPALKVPLGKPEEPGVDE